MMAQLRPPPAAEGSLPGPSSSEQVSIKRRANPGARAGRATDWRTAGSAANIGHLVQPAANITLGYLFPCIAVGTP